VEYRPEKLDDVLGNAAVKKSLASITFDKPLLFEGDTGTGKTLCAYIMAKRFGAPNENITDINCVHFSKVDDVRAMMDRLNKSSLFGDKKVLILDELHGLAYKSKQELLKPLESLSKKILIIGCTTTVSSIDQAVLDRFDRFKLKPLTLKESKELLNRICEQENISLTKWKTSLLLDKVKGNPRRLFSGLSKIIDVDEDEEIRYILELDEVEDSDVLKLMKLLLADTRWNIIREELDKLLNSKSPDSIRVGLVNLIGSRLMSNYFKGNNEGEKLLNLHKYVDKELPYPEKYNLTVALYRYCREERA